MNIISIIIASIVTVGLAHADIEFNSNASRKPNEVDWYLQFEHPDSIKDIPSARGWTHLTHGELKIAVLIGMSWTDGESNIPVTAYLYNQHFKEWRQFMTLQTRNAYMLRAEIDDKHKTLNIVGGKHSPLEGRIIASYSLAAVSDDRAYANNKRVAEQAGAGQPATHSESKSEGDDKPQSEAQGHSR